jgi:hypothetical protein
LADNISITAGAGTVVASDEIAGVHYQFVKLAFGPLDTATLVTSSVGLPVSDAGGSLTVDNGGTFAVQATLAAETTKVIGTVNVASGQTIATTVADGGNVTFGSKADAKSAATDATAVSIVSVLKQISASVQAPPSQAVTNAGTFAVQSAVSGDTAHGATNAGNPLQSGYEAIAHGANPTAVTAGQRTKGYANRAGIPFVMGGTPNIVTIEAAYTAAQTDTALVTVSTGTKIVVTQIQVVTDSANTAFPQIRVGFGTANTPTTTGVVLTHPGLPAGGGVSRGDGSGILGVGSDDADLRVTCGAPTGGSLRVLCSYYTIES